MIPVWLAALPSAAQSACPDDPVAEMEKDIAAIWHAFDVVDEAGLDRASKALSAAVACLDVSPAPAQVSRLHQAMGVIGFVNGQIRASRRALAAARLMDPSWKLTEDQFPEGHMFRDLHTEATDPGPVDNIGKINPKVWIVDGIERDEAPTERAFLLQVRDGDTVVWSGYVHDWEELPDYGQAQARSVLEAPHQWWLSATVHGGALTSRQRATDSAVWQNQSGTTFAGGADLTFRATPITVVGVEVSASFTGPSDPVEGSGGLPSAHAVALLGGAGWTGGVQPYAAARIGGGYDRIRTWTNGPAEGPQIDLWTVGSLVAGIEAGIRANRQRVAVAADGRLALARVPYQLRVRADGGALVVGPLALEGLLELRTGSTAVLDRDVTIGSRNDLDLRVGGGIAIWQ